MIHINYIFDGPCGDCPLNLSRQCDTANCIHWIAWDKVLEIIRELTE